MRPRVVTGYATVFLLVASLFLFAWATNHPDSPALRRAEAWPVVGKGVAAFRRVWSPGSEPSGGGATEAGEAAGPRRRLVVVGGGGEGEGGLPTSLGELPGRDAGEAAGAAGRDLPAGADTVWLEPGTRLLTEPRTGADLVTESEIYANRSVVRREGSWALVRHETPRGTVLGWVEAPQEAPGPAGEPPLGSDPVPPRPLPALAAEPRRVEQAVEMLGPAAQRAWLGGYVLLTDVEDAAYLATLDTVAAQVERIYRRRYDRDPVGEPAETVVLFARESDYRSFQSAERRIAGLPATGHATPGMIALYRGGQATRSVAATLVHEITHLLNRRALGPALPPWLDEGIAQDMAWARLGAGGRLDPGRLGGGVVQDGNRVTFRGGLATPLHLVRSAERGRRLALEDLLALDWEGFVRRDRDLHYALSGLFVRFLVAGRGGELAPGFRRFLDGTAEGRPVTAERLAAELGMSWREIQTLFDVWVRWVAEDPERRGGG